MDQKLQDVEYKFFSKALRTSDDKYFIQAYKIYLDLLWLNGEVGRISAVEWPRLLRPLHPNPTSRFHTFLPRIANSSREFLLETPIYAVIQSE